MEELQNQIRPLLAKLLHLIDEHQAKRSEALKAFDKDTPANWFKSSETIAYILYADLFSPEAPQGQKLEALRKQIHYFNDLGINLIHILPLLKSSGDAGFAVDDYETVDEKLGINKAYTLP